MHFSWGILTKTMTRKIQFPCVVWVVVPWTGHRVIVVYGLESEVKVASFSACDLIAQISEESQPISIFIGKWVLYKYSAPDSELCLAQKLSSTEKKYNMSVFINLFRVAKSTTGVNMNDLFLVAVSTYLWAVWYFPTAKSPNMSKCLSDALCPARDIMNEKATWNGLLSSCLGEKIYVLCTR